MNKLTSDLAEALRATLTAIVPYTQNDVAGRPWLSAAFAALTAIDTPAPELPEDTPVFTFNGVTIGIQATSAAAAYSELCETIPDNWYFETDTYRGADEKDADTSDLFPCDCGRPRVMCATFDDSEAEHGDRP